MWTIDDPLDEQELMIPLVLRAQPLESGKNKGKTAEKEPDRLPFPWEVPFPDEQEWQNFLAALFHELRGEPACFRIFFDALDRAIGVRPK